MVDPYAVLGVRPGSTEQQVAAAYKQLAKRWHPDRGAGEEGERRMAEINVAYDVLRAGEPGGARLEDRVAGSGRPAGSDSRRVHGWWLPDWIRRALGAELLQALSQQEEILLVTPVSTSASPRAILAVTERRLLWLLDDAPVARVRSLAFRDVAAVGHQLRRPRRRLATLAVRSLGGRRHTFGGLHPQTALAIERHVRAGAPKAL
jgi:hypothetical protein